MKFSFGTDKQIISSHIIGWNSSEISSVQWEVRLCILKWINFKSHQTIYLMKSAFLRATPLYSFRSFPLDYQPCPYLYDPLIRLLAKYLTFHNDGLWELCLLWVLERVTHLLFYSWIQYYLHLKRTRQNVLNSDFKQYPTNLL